MLGSKDNYETGVQHFQRFEKMRIQTSFRGKPVGAGRSSIVSITPAWGKMGEGVPET
jgi:hypothetical protein